jgi:tRNA A-37 threonylcarbamoyl transferase component Bud32
LNYLETDKYNSRVKDNSRDYAYLDVRKSSEDQMRNSNNENLLNIKEDNSLPRFGTTTGQNISLSNANENFIVEKSVDKQKEKTAHMLEEKEDSSSRPKFKLDLGHLPETVQDKLHQSTKKELLSNDRHAKHTSNLNDSFAHPEHSHNENADNNLLDDEDSFGNTNIEGENDEDNQQSLLNLNKHKFMAESTGLINEKNSKEINKLKDRVKLNITEDNSNNAFNESFFANHDGDELNKTNTLVNEGEEIIYDKTSENSLDDEYVDDDDPGFDLYECEPQHFNDTCKKLSEQYDFPRRAIKKKKPNEKTKPFNAHNLEMEKEIEKKHNKKNDLNISIRDNDNLNDAERQKLQSNKNLNFNLSNNSNSQTEKDPGKDMNIVKVLDPEVASMSENKGEKIYEVDNMINDKSNTNKPPNSNIVVSHNISNSAFAIAKKRKELLPAEKKFMPSSDPYYPILYSNTIYDSFSLNVIVDRERTGFEESKDFKIIVNSLIAGRYQVLDYLGSAVFSKAVKCLDILENKIVCLKIIENNKDYLDQSLDEIKLMRYINANEDVDEKNILKLYDYFYHKEHLFIVTEVLKDNLYEFYKYINDKKLEKYFNLKRIQAVASQIIVGLEYLHSLKIIHCDLKPENILMKSISKSEVKIIDFGSSCFLHDHLSNYMQSRSYRAPEVILGLSYDYKIDMWSLGCILAELFTGNVLFQNDSIQSYLAKILSIAGPFPEYMFKGKHSADFFAKQKLIFMEINDNLAENSNIIEQSNLGKSSS